MNEYLKLLSYVLYNTVTFKSNYARDRASLIAEACSRGHLTCLSPLGKNVGVWLVSKKGMDFMSEWGGIR